MSGVENMARDEALLTIVGTGVSPPTLRLYQWCPPTISLGYFQHFTDYQALAPPANSLAVVRRLTGGGAILHDLELTYSIALLNEHPLLKVGPNQLYALAHDAIIAALGRLRVEAARGGPSDDSGAARGPFFCFDRRHCYDVISAGAKIAGSAQRRTRAAILQHGSIVVGNRYSQQRTATVALGAEAAIQHVRQLLGEELSRITNVPVTTGDWTREELSAAESLRAKYAGSTWTQRS